MTIRRSGFWMLWLFLGVGAGAAGVLCWQQASPRVEARETRSVELPARRWEATVYLPLADNRGRLFPEAEWQAALALLVRELGGATLAAPLEGCWRDNDGELQREPVRPVIVSFEPDQLPLFRRVVEQVGQRLGQKVMYTRFEQPRFELLTVPPGRPPSP